MDGRIVGVTEDLVRKVFNLCDTYEPTQCNVKKNHVEIEMCNELISIKVKIPREIIDAQINGSCVTYMLNENCGDSEDTEGEKGLEETNESIEHEDELSESNMEQMKGTQKKSKRRVKPNGKAKKKE